MSVAHRFGGWLRLWIVVVAIYALAVTIGAVATATSRSEIIANWNNEIFQTLAADVQRTTGKEITATQFRASKDFQNKSDEQIAQEMTRNAKDIDTTKPDKQDLGQYKQDIASLAEKYEVKLGNLPLEHVKHAGLAFLIWLLPSLSVLALGYAVGWVIHGFKKA